MSSRFIISSSSSLSFLALPPSLLQLFLSFIVSFSQIPTLIMCAWRRMVGRGIAGMAFNFGLIISSIISPTFSSSCSVFLFKQQLDKQTHSHHACMQQDGCSRMATIAFNFGVMMSSFITPSFSSSFFCLCFFLFRIPQRTNEHNKLTLIMCAWRRMVARGMAGIALSFGLIMSSFISLNRASSCRLFELTKWTKRKDNNR